MFESILKPGAQLLLRVEWFVAAVGAQIGLRVKDISKRRNQLSNIFERDERLCLRLKNDIEHARTRIHFLEVKPVIGW